MSCFVVMAVKAAGEGKSRLSEALDTNDRKELNNRMFRHVFNIVRQVVSSHNIIVISRSQGLLDEVRSVGVHGLLERGNELNAALTQASETAVELGATSLLTLSSDLPFLEANDLRAMLTMHGDVVIATDRHRIGTNALLIRRPFSIPYRYGGESLDAHKLAAAQAGLFTTVIERPGLARDIDTPDDLAELN